MRDGQAEATTFPLLLFWLLPSGRFALWFLMTFFLAQLATNIPPDPSTLGLWDLGLLLYLVGWLKTEAAEAVSDMRRDGIRRYLTDTFNILDMLLVLLLSALLLTRHSYTLDADSTMGSLAPPFQALLALVAWLRLMQVLFIFPTTGVALLRALEVDVTSHPHFYSHFPPPPSSAGPLLIMTIRMLEDLWQFLTLAAFVVMAFACAFFVLFSHSHALDIRARRESAAAAQIEASWNLSAEDTASLGATALGGDVSTDVDDEQAYDWEGPLNIWQVLGLLIDASIKGEPDHVIVQGPEASNYFLWG